MFDADPARVLYLVCSNCSPSKKDVVKLAIILTNLRVAVMMGAISKDVKCYSPSKTAVIKMYVGSKI